MLRPISIACLSAMLLASSQVLALPPQEIIDAINRQQHSPESLAATNNAPASQKAVTAVKNAPPVQKAAMPVTPPPPSPQRAVATATSTLAAPEEDQPKLADPTKILLDTKNWGDAKPEDVQAVLDSTVNTIMPYMEYHPLGNILVRRSNKPNPDSLYEKGPRGEYIIELSADGNHWSQYVYQFSHEMCHLISNYDLAANNASQQQWLDEAMCDAFSLFTLQQMEAQWKTKPPYPNWQDYAPNFRQYAEDELNQPHRTLPAGMTLSTWVSQHQQQLSNDPYAEERRLSEVAGKQLLPIFAANPQSWAALNFLNLGDDSQDKSLLMFLTDWQMNAPPDIQETIGQVQQLLLPGR